MLPRHFSREAHFFSDNHYHRPNLDCCVQSISDLNVTLKLWAWVGACQQHFSHFFSVWTSLSETRIPRSQCLTMAPPTASFLPSFLGSTSTSPRGVFVAISFVLICLTMGFVWKASKTKAGAQNGRTYYSAKLYPKLFLGMGGASGTDFISWHYNSEGARSWLLVLLEVLSSLTPIPS